MSATFASWVRSGVAAASPGLLELATDAVRLRARVRASVNGLPSKAVQLDVLGPGDVTGLAPGVIVRTDPHPGAEGFETTRFATIEFSRADLPWLFTPAAPGAGMKPWIVLVVVPATECELAPRANRPPVLTVSSTELPPPDQSWAWAHVQVPTPGGALAGPAPAGSRSRLFCPRPLRPFTRYLAAVVPAYEAGRLAGVGSEPGAVTAMAWDPANATTVDLPAYHHWWFSTGESGDFESIARGLVALPDPPTGLGLGHLDASDPGPPTLAATNRVTDLLGAARGARRDPRRVVAGRAGRAGGRARTRPGGSGPRASHVRRDRRRRGRRADDRYASVARSAQPASGQPRGRRCRRQRRAPAAGRLRAGGVGAGRRGRGGQPQARPGPSRPAGGRGADPAARHRS